MLPSSRQRPHSVPSHRQSPERGRARVRMRPRQARTRAPVKAKRCREKSWGKRAPPAESPAVAQLWQAAPLQVTQGEGVGHPAARGRLSPARARPACAGASLILIGRALSSGPMIGSVPPRPARSPGARRFGQLTPRVSTTPTV